MTPINTMRSELDNLTRDIDGYNAEFKTAIDQMVKLQFDRDKLIERGRKILTKKQMQSMLLSARITVSNTPAEPVPLGDVLQEFASDPSDITGAAV